MSRSSSVSVRDKTKKNRPAKQRRDDSEGFDVRSAYTPFYPQAQQPTWAPAPQFAPMTTPPYNIQIQAGYQGPPQATYGQSPQQMYPPMITSGATQPYNQMTQVRTMLHLCHIATNSFLAAVCTAAVTVPPTTTAICTATAAVPAAYATAIPNPQRSNHCLWISSSDSTAANATVAYAKYLPEL